MKDTKLQEVLCLSNALSDEKWPQDLKPFKEKAEKMISNLKKAVESSRAAADKLDDVWSKHKFAHIAGKSVEIFGGLLTVGGGIATFMTAGAASPFLFAGLTFGLAGAGTNITAQIIESLINSNEIKNANRDMKVALDSLAEVKNILDDLLEKRETSHLSFILDLAAKSNPTWKLLAAILYSTGIVDATGKVVLTEACQTGVQLTVQVSAHAAAEGSQAVGKAGAEAASKAGAQAVFKAGAQAAGKAGAEAASKAGAEAASKAGAQAVGKAGAEAAGKAGAEAASKAGAQAVGKAGAQAAGKAGAEAASKAGTQAVGKAGAQAAGKAGAEAASKAGAQAAGKAGAEAASKAGAQAAGEGVKGAAKASGQVADDVLQAGVKLGSQSAAKVIIGVSAVMLVWDTIDLSFTIYDLVNKKGSEAAKELRKKADELEKLYKYK